jgi:hypothetical protein
MSRNEWELGTIKLPTGEFPKVRKAVEDADKASKTKLFDASQKVWKDLGAKQRRDHGAYEQAIRSYCFDPVREPTRWDPDPPRRCGLSPQEAEELYHLLGRGQRERTENPNQWGQRTDKPRRILRDDLEWPTNRTTVFRVDGDTTIAFDRDASSVTWNVNENNHAVDDARSHPLAGAFFKALDNVTWTRGTGGVFVGNDEYNEEAGREYEGGGGSYPTGGFGPIGAERAPGHTRPYRTAKGKVDPLAPKTGRGQGRVQRGVPTGGQFASRRHGESTVRL